jgi:polygalacturonase
MNNILINDNLNILNFGAIGDGNTNCTKAFAAAIKVCHENGGGTIYVPAGTYKTGAIHFISNMNLYVDAGAVILFSNDLEDYPLVFDQWEGIDRQVYSPLIYGKDLENISITGHGLLSGQGEFWWKSSKELAYPRPRMICFNSCKNVLIEGVRIINSPSWTINPIACENVTVNKITIKNPADSPNTDGINPSSCKNVHISNCHVDVGDDCITIKSGTEDSLKKIACENITVTNCTMVHGHGGVVIGSEMSGSIRNVTISNCVFEGTDRGIRIKSRRGRGGVVEDIRVNNIVMKNVICPFIMNLYYFCGPRGKDKYVWDKNPYPVTEETPIFRRIHFSNITAREVHAAAGFLYGLAEMPVEDITFDNVFVAMAKDAVPGKPAMMDGIEPMKQKGFFCCNVKNISFNGVSVSGHEGPAFTVEKGEQVEFFRCSSENLNTKEPMVSLEEVKDVSINFKEVSGNGDCC